MASVRTFRKDHLESKREKDVQILFAPKVITTCSLTNVAFLEILMELRMLSVFVKLESLLCCKIRRRGQREGGILSCPQQIGKGNNDRKCFSP